MIMVMVVIKEVIMVVGSWTEGEGWPVWLKQFNIRSQEEIEKDLDMTNNKLFLHLQHFDRSVQNRDRSSLPVW